MSTTSAESALTVADLDWGATPAPPWTSDTDIIAAAIALLPELVDDDAARLVERMALTLVERDEQIAAIRTTLSITLAQLHVAERENRRLKARRNELLDERRAWLAPRTAA